MQREMSNQRKSSLPEDKGGPISNKRRRTSDRPRSLAPPDQQANANDAQSPGHSMLTSVSPQRASSRDVSPSDEVSGSIRYTRTGRVSKATKGQRVHQCHHCSKVSDIPIMC